MNSMGGKQLVNKVLVLLVIAAVAGAALGLWLLPPGDADASGHSATRSFSPTTVAPGDTVTVTIVASNFGGVGKIEETVPAEFGGGTREFGLVGGSDTVTYTVTAADRPGTHTFSGTVYDSAKDGRVIGGQTMVTIAKPGEPQPTASRSMPSSVNRGAEFTVSIQAADFGGLGQVIETLPEGFTSPDADGGKVTLALLGDSETRTYRVTAPDTTGTYTFSGTLETAEKNSYAVSGRSTITVRQPAPPPTQQPPGPTDRRGMVTLSTGMPMVGDMLTATLTDPDGSISGTTWQWSRCEDSAGVDCSGIADTNSASYTPVEADVGKYLEAKAIYRDARGPAKMADAVTANAVEMANILSDYDADDSGRIEKSEAVTAVLDYLIRGDITKDEAVEVVTAFILQTAV